MNNASTEFANCCTCEASSETSADSESKLLRQVAAGGSWRPLPSLSERPFFRVKWVKSFPAHSPHSPRMTATLWQRFDHARNIVADATQGHQETPKSGVWQRPYLWGLRFPPRQGSSTTPGKEGYGIPSAQMNEIH